MPIKKLSSSLNLIDSKNQTKTKKTPKESPIFANTDKYSTKVDWKYKT